MEKPHHSLESVHGRCPRQLVRVEYEAWIGKVREDEPLL
jgi:hypothetical protein